MSNIEQLRAFVFERLTATAEEIFGVFEKVIHDHRADLPQLYVCKEEVTPEQQERSHSLGQEDPEPPQIKEEQEEIWTSQEGEQLQWLEEADAKDPTFTKTSVRSLHDQHQRHLNRTVESREAEPLPSTSTEADGDGWGISEPTTDLQPLSSDCSVAESDGMDRDEDWMLRGGPQSGLKTKTAKRQSSGVRTSMESSVASCKACGESFTSNAGLIQHVETHSEDAQCVCGVCGTHVESTQSLVDHLKSHKISEIPLKPYSCSVCDKEFSSSRCKAIHMRIHTGERLHTCSICNKKFTVKCHLTRHMASHTGDRPHVCHFCGKGFSRVGSMNTHMRIHTGEKPYGCTDCGKSFRLGSDLSRHMRIHTGERPHLCSVCGKGFRTLGHLKAHMCIHTGEKRHTCSVCGKGFSQVGSMKIHMSIHTGEKRHTCSVCGKGFSQVGNMQAHMRIHTGEKPYGCTDCGKSFRHGSDLSKHRMRIHAREKTHKTTH